MGEEHACLSSSLVAKKLYKMAKKARGLIAEGMLRAEAEMHSKLSGKRGGWESCHLRARWDEDGSILL